MIGKAQKATCTSHQDEKFQQLYQIALGKKKFAKKSPVTVVFSFPHSLCFPSPSYSPPAMLLHTHSSHASTFLLLSSSISPFLHLLLCLPISFSPPSLCNTFLGENRTRPGMLLLAWVVSRRIKNR